MRERGCYASYQAQQPLFWLMVFTGIKEVFSSPDNQPVVLINQHPSVLIAVSLIAVRTVHVSTVGIVIH
jgi:hypothetical protein